MMFMLYYKIWRLHNGYWRRCEERRRENFALGGKISTLNSKWLDFPWGDPLNTYSSPYEVRNFTDSNNLPNLLFYGPPGTGKTSTIKALAKELYKKDYMKMVLELNASDERGIDVVRTEIKSFASNKTLSMYGSDEIKEQQFEINYSGWGWHDDSSISICSEKKYVLCYEVIEKYTGNARFCLISNYVTKIIPALQSRCTRFKFKQIPFDDAIKRILAIC